VSSFKDEEEEEDGDEEERDNDKFSINSSTATIENRAQKKFREKSPPLFDPLINCNSSNEENIVAVVAFPLRQERRRQSVGTAGSVTPTAAWSRSPSQEERTKVRENEDINNDVESVNAAAALKSPVQQNGGGTLDHLPGNFCSFLKNYKFILL
jgi:hypothetical protein